MSTLLSYLFAFIMMSTADQCVTMGRIEPTTNADFNVSPVRVVVPPGVEKVHRYIEASSRMLDRRVQRALKGIDGISRRLLALKYYQKRRGSIKTSWAWTREQAMRYKKSREYGRSIEVIASISRAFEELNPGYSVGANTDIRGIGDQVQLWNETQSVETSANALMETTMREMADSTWPDAPDKRSLQRFHRFLAQARVPIVPTVAVPGFSQHGRLRAFDFVVKRGDAIVAGTDASSARSVWDAGGWTKKLKEAVEATSDRFVGPLSTPYEPWHYEYAP